MLHKNSTDMNLKKKNSPIAVYSDSDSIGLEFFLMCTVYIETESRHFACKLFYCPMINDSERYKNPSLFCINKAVGFIDIVVIDTVIVIVPIES